MVNNNINFETQLRELIKESQNELANIENKIKSLEYQRGILLEELQSYETSLKGYLKRIGKQEDEIKPIDWDKILKNTQSHKQRLIKIAENEGGLLKMSFAVDLLYSRKYIKSKTKHNAYVQIYQIVMGMVDKRELEKVEPGVFRLVSKDRLF